jgi:hypothetical protein
MYCRTLENVTPYQALFDREPSVEHPREFGMLVWVLLQGRQELHKILSKSICQTYVGFKDGPRAIKYYNMESWKVLTLRNFCFLSSRKDPSPEPIEVDAPDVPHEGELRGSHQRAKNTAQKVQALKGSELEGVRK